MHVHEGIYRATATRGRGRKRRRGEFVALSEATARPVSSLDADGYDELNGIDEPASEQTAATAAELRVAEEHHSDGQVSLRLRGSLELTTVLPFRDAVFSVLGRRPTSLELDLRGVDNVDTIGISTLVTVDRVARLLKVPCRIAPSPSFGELLEATRIGRMLAMGPVSGVQ